MGTVVHSIGTGGTHDYTSLAAWAAALPANLVTDGNAQRAELYFNGSGDGEFVVNGNVLTLTGHNTNSTNNITITTGPGQSFRDRANVRTNALTYNPSNGVALQATAGYITAIVINDNDVVLSNLQIKCYVYRSNVLTCSGPLTVNNCIFSGLVSNINNNPSAATTWNNCLFIGLVVGTASVITIDKGTNTFNSCTFVTPSDLLPIAVFVMQVGYNTTYLNNCALFGASGNPLYLYHGTVVASNCATDYATPASGFTGSLTYASQFMGVTSTAMDWRLKPGSFLIDHGAFVSQFILSYAPGSERNDYTGSVGVSFVPTIDITIKGLGVRCASGNTGGWTVELRDWSSPSSPTLLRSTVADLTGATVGAYRYASITTITLTAGHAYYIGTITTGGGQSWANNGPVTLLNVGSISASYIDSGGVGHNAPADTMYAGVDSVLDTLTTDISFAVTPSGLNYDIGAWEYIAGLVTHSVGIGGTHDYTSLAAWAAALPANIVADGNAQRAELYFNGSGDGEFLSTSGHLLQLTGHTTDPIHTIKITTGLGQGFKDNAGVRTNPLRYDASKGVALRCFAGYSNVVNLRDNNVIFENLQFMGDSGNYGTIDSTGASGNNTVQFNNCLILNQTGAATSVVDLFQGFDNAIFRNCALIHNYQAGTAGAGVVTGRGGEYYFCTFVVPSGSAVTGGSAATVSAYAGGVTPIVKNCAIFGFANLYTNQTPTYINCATDLASPPSGVTGSLTYANQFEDVTLSGGFDFRSKRGASLRGAGVADVLNGAADISGLARPAGGAWDVGAWELAFGTVTHSIGIGGTHDYTSLAAWAAALPANLITDTNAQRAELYFNGSGDGEFVNSTGSVALLSLTGHTTNSSHAITLTTGPGQSFRDRVDVRTNALRYDPTKGVALYNSLGFTPNVYIIDSNVTVSNLQIKQSGPGSEHALRSDAPGPFTLENCIIEADQLSGGNMGVVQLFYSTGGGVVVRNCVVIQSSSNSNSPALRSGQVTVSCYFCTFVHPSDQSPLIVATPIVNIGFSPTPIIQNCAMFGALIAAGGDGTTFTGAFTSCVTDQASPPAGFTTVAYANQFENALSTAQDWRLKSGSGLIGVGTADPVVLTDISGVLRGPLVDVGAWEFAADVVGPPLQTLIASLFGEIVVIPNQPRIVS